MFDCFILSLPDEALGSIGTRTRHKPKGNPLLLTFGRDPEGRKCKTCALLYYRQASKRFYKCKLRKATHGPGSDHKVNWPACGKFEPAKTA